VQLLHATGAQANKLPDSMDAQLTDRVGYGRLSLASSSFCFFLIFSFCSKYTLQHNYVINTLRTTLDRRTSSTMSIDVRETFHDTVAFGTING